MKKGMKKILSVAIVLAMTMSLAACGGGTKETQGQASSETAAASGESAGTEAGETSIGEIKRGGTLTLRRTGTTPINPTQVIAPAGDIGMPISGSIGHAIGLGLISYTFVKVLSGKAKDVSVLTYVISALFLVKFFAVV